MQFATKQARYRVGARDLELRVLESFEAAVNELCDELPAGISDRDLLAACPFFGKVWSSAGAAAKVLTGEIAGKRVLELGCGLALPSLVAASLGATVVASDYHPDVPGFLAENLRANGLGGRVRYEHLDWPLEHRALGAFDCVIASDCLYTPWHAQQLATVISRHLAPGGMALVSDPGRAYLQDFVGAMGERALEGRLTVDGEIYLLCFKAVA